MPDDDTRHTATPPGDSPEASSATRSRVFQYKAFLSYNQQADTAIAAALERGLEQFAKKWYQRRAFDVFRDASSLSANSALWPALQANLDNTEFLILLASPESAASPWVPKELAYWLSNRGHRNVLFVLTAGEIRWNESLKDFDWTKTTALNPKVFQGTFEQEPLWVDCRWARGLDPAAIARDKRFPDAVASFAEPLHGKPKSDLYGEDLHQHRRQMRWARMAVASLVILLLLALGLWRQEGIARKDAVLKTQIANSRRLAALSTSERNNRLDRSLLLAVEAVEAIKKGDTFEARDALFKALHSRPGLRTFLQIKEGEVRDVAFSPDGKAIAVGYSLDINDRAGGVVLLDVAAPERPAGEHLPMSEGGVVGVSFSPDGKTIAAGYGGGVVVWDVARRVRLIVYDLPVKKAHVLGVAFSPDGETIAAGYSTRDGEGGVVLWDVASRVRPAVVDFTVKEGDVRCVAFSPDRRSIAAGYSRGVAGGVVLWNVAGRKRLTVEPLSVKEGQVSSLAFSSDGKALAAGYNSFSVRGDGVAERGDGVVLWDLVTLKRLTVEPLPVEEGSVGNVRFSPDSKFIAASFSGRGGVVLWDVSTRKRLLDHPLILHEGGVAGLAFSPDGKTIATGYGNILEEAHGVALCDVTPRDCLAEDRFAIKGGMANGVAFSPDGKTVAAIYTSPRKGEVVVIRLDVKSQARISDDPFRGNRFYLSGQAFSPDCKTIATAFSSGGIELWDVAERKWLAQEPRVVKEGEVLGLAFSPYGKTLAAGYRNEGDVGGGVVLFDVAASRRLSDGPLLVNEGGVTSLAFSPDGKTVGAGYNSPGRLDGGVVLWEVATRERRTKKAFEVKEGQVRGLAFSPDGKTLAAGCGIRGSLIGIGAVVLWDVAGGVRLSNGTLTSKEGDVTVVAFSPNGKAIAAGYDGGDGGGVVLWDVAARERLADDPFRVSEGPILSLAFSPDGKTLAAGCGDIDRGGVVFLDVDLKSWEQKAGRIANRNFTREEWHQYFHDNPYRATFCNLPIAPEAKPVQEVSSVNRTR